MKRLKKWTKSLIELFFPRYCAVCGKRLEADEQALCIHCLTKLPRTNYHLWRDNPVDKLFWGKFPLGRATAWIFYNRKTPFAHMIHHFKYKGRKTLAVSLGKMMANEILPSGFFNDIDYIIPIPLHTKRLRQRGYNQSTCLASGIQDIVGIPVLEGMVIRARYTETQTRKNANDRRENVHDVFQLTERDKLKGKHVLIVDDVLTTSATITACADILKNITGIRISVLTLAVAM